MNSLQKAAPYAILVIALAVLAATMRAFLNHEINGMALMFAAQISILAAVFAPPVLNEMRDRQTLSVYRAMRLAPVPVR